MTWIQHVNVVVPPGGTAAAAAFYRDVFGLRVVDKPAALDPVGAWLQAAGEQQLHISERAGAVHADAHFALVVDDFDQTRRLMDAAGAPWTEQEDVFGGRRGFTRDPAGNRVEVLEATGSFAP
ncbi:MAG TPA: VOC family protein [Mycobacteriales bacterium]|jgi:catechol 2,3-dioxygenase-like lactoylglutathione lyase family enzyme|nr:VOC family protein [Mycobacteriales bacterium]